MKPEDSTAWSLGTEDLHDDGARAIRRTSISARSGPASGSISSVHSRLPRPLSAWSTVSPAIIRLHHRERVRREMRAAEAVLAERLGGERDPALERLDHRLGIDADLVLRVGVGAQAQEVEQIVADRSSNTTAYKN